MSSREEHSSDELFAGARSRADSSSSSPSEDDSSSAEPSSTAIEKSQKATKDTYQFRDDLNEFRCLLRTVVEPSRQTATLWRGRNVTTQRVFWPSMVVDKKEEEADIEEELLDEEPPIVDKLAQPPSVGVDAPDNDLASLATSQFLFVPLLPNMTFVDQHPVGRTPKIDETPAILEVAPAIRELNVESDRFNAFATSFLSNSNLAAQIPPDRISRGVLGTEVMKFVRDSFDNLLRNRLDTYGKVRSVASVIEGNWEDTLIAIEPLLPAEVVDRVKQRSEECFRASAPAAQTIELEPTTAAIRKEKRKREERRDDRNEREGRKKRWYNE